jgi:hypothetical protein
MSTQAVGKVRLRTFKYMKINNLKRLLQGYPQHRDFVDGPPESVGKRDEVAGI